MLSDIHVDITIKSLKIGRIVIANWATEWVTEWNLAAGMIPHFSGPGPPKLRLGPSFRFAP